MTPVPKYRQAWVQVSPHSSYKVLKWVPRDHATRPQTNRSAQSDQTSAPCFINDPNTIDGSSDEENDLEDDDDGGGSERNGGSTVPGASPSRSFKLGRKTSRAIAQTEGAGGQLAGLETGHIAEQIEIDDDEDENRSVSGTQDHPPLVAPTPSDPQLASERSPLPQSQANQEVGLKEMNIEEQSYNDAIDGRSYENEGGDIEMRDGNQVSGQAQWSEKTLPNIGSDQGLGLGKALGVPVMSNLSTGPPTAASLPVIAPDGQSFVENTEHSKAPQSTQSFNQSLPPVSLHPSEISAPMEVDTPQPQEASPNDLWQQSEIAELPDSRTTISSGPREVISKDLTFYPIPGLGTVDHEGSLPNLESQSILAKTENTLHHVPFDHESSATTLDSKAMAMIPAERTYNGPSATEMDNDGVPVTETETDNDGVPVVDDDSVPVTDNDGLPVTDNDGTPIES